MAKIWNDVEIEWNGKTYRVTPSITFLNYIERGDGQSLRKMYLRAMDNDLPCGAACELIAKTIAYADPKSGVDAEDVFEATVGGLDGTAVSLAISILQACIPAPKDPPKAKQPGKQPARNRKTTRTTGE